MKREEESKYLEKLSRVKGLGWRRAELLGEYYGSFYGVWTSESREWVALGVPEWVAESFRNAKSEEKERQSSVGKSYIKFVSYLDQEYPEKLRLIASPPLGLYCEGEIGLLQEDSLAVVGTRKMSEYGKKVTENFTRGLTDGGYVIVSGLARGVDGVAHRSCLRRKGKTIAVLAHGLDMVYPKEHFKLMKRIVEEEGLVVSEHPVGVKPKKQYFRIRNRIVAGLAEAVVVCEAPRKSGTKITVGFAAEQGKDVYVIPGPITSKSYWGSVEIIRDGGMPVYRVEDLLGN